MALIKKIHPLALGNVHRSHQQIRQLTRNFLAFHPVNKRDISEIVEKLTTGFYSHYHSIDRTEAAGILGDERVKFASPELETALDKLLREHENDFELRKPFFVAHFLKNDPEKTARFIGGAVESSERSYLFETNVSMKQFPKVPQGVQFQLQQGQTLLSIAGLPRAYEFVVTSQAWIHNKAPKGVTLT